MTCLNSTFLIAFFPHGRDLNECCPNLLHFSHIDFWKSSSGVHNIFLVDTNNPYYCVWYCWRVSLPKSIFKFSLCPFFCCWFLNEFPCKYCILQFVYYQTADMTSCLHLAHCPTILCSGFCYLCSCKAMTWNGRMLCFSIKDYYSLRYTQICNWTSPYGVHDLEDFQIFSHSIYLHLLDMLRLSSYYDMKFLHAHLKLYSIQLRLKSLASNGPCDQK